MPERKTSFMRNAAILTAGGMVVRTLGAVYRIPLARLIGDEGMGLYQMAYPIYATLLAISLSGPPVAIAKMVAERVAVGNYRSAHRVFRLSFALLFAVGMLVTLGFALNAERFAASLGDERAYWSLVAMIPAIFFVSLMSALRGYFQGLQDMVPYAVSQVIEQVARVATALGLGIYLLQRGVGLEYISGGVSLGVTVGAIGGLAVLGRFYILRKKGILKRAARDAESRKDTPQKIVRELVILAVPITFGGLVVSLMQLIDAAVVPRRLQAAGFSPENATALFGQLSGMATPLINLPQMVTVAIVASLVPAIAEALSLRRRSLIVDRSNLALKASMLFNFPAAVGLSVLATPIAVLLYGSQAAGVGIPLGVLAYVVAFLAVQQTTTGILQGLGKTYVPVISIALGAMVKLILSYSLTAMPTLNVRGAALSTVLAYGVSSAFNVLAVYKGSRIPIDWDRVFLRPGLAAVGMGLMVHYTSGPVFARVPYHSLATLVSLGLGILSYVILVFLVGALKPSELGDIPIIGRIVRRVYK
jgi:stage V sporulation protein B